MMIRSAVSIAVVVLLFGATFVRAKDDSDLENDIAGNLLRAYRRHDSAAGEDRRLKGKGKGKGEADCPPADCPATVPCCINGSCIDVPETSCSAVGGSLADQECSVFGDACPTPIETGACCINYSCVDVSDNDCSIIGGQFDGTTDCDTKGIGDLPGQCPAPPTGACCYGTVGEEDQQCNLYTQSECEALQTGLCETNRCSYGDTNSLWFEENSCSATCDVLPLGTCNEVGCSYSSVEFLCEGSWTWNPS